jgi:hypothetical protein
VFGTTIPKRVILNQIVENVLFRSLFLKNCDLKTTKILCFQIANKGCVFRNAQF